MQSADLHIRSILEFGFLPKDNLTCRAGQSSQQPSDNKMLGKLFAPVSSLQAKLNYAKLSWATAAFLSNSRQENE